MDSSVLKDWVFRYNHLFKKRYTNNQITRFIKSLIGDIHEYRDDIVVTEIETKGKDKIRNIYVGDVKNADTIIATYFDTPSVYFGSYKFFDEEDRQKKSLTFNIIMSILIFAIGILYSLYIAIPYLNESSILLVLLILAGYIIIFWLLNRFSRGYPKANTAVRNTSSVIYLLWKISSVRSKRVAFAFVDKGSKNNIGLEALLDISKKSSKVYYLDSIGSKNELILLTDKNVRKGNIDSHLNLTHVISAKKIDGDYILEESDLKEMDNSKLDQLDQLLNI